MTEIYCYREKNRFVAVVAEDGSVLEVYDGDTVDVAVDRANRDWPGAQIDDHLIDERMRVLC
jgi:hypothetical protein